MPSKSSTRSHGEGSIYRSDYTRPSTGVTIERWIASVDLGVGASGKRLRKKITGGRQLDQLTVAQVEAWLRVEAESGGKGGKPQARVTCRDYKQMLGEMLEWAVARPLLDWCQQRGLITRERAQPELNRAPERLSRGIEIDF